MYVFVNRFTVLRVFLTVGYDLKTLKSHEPSRDLRRSWSRCAKALAATTVPSSLNLKPLGSRRNADFLSTRLGGG